MSFVYHLSWLVLVAHVIEKSKSKFFNPKIPDLNHFFTEQYDKKNSMNLYSSFLTTKHIIITLKTQNQIKYFFFLSFDLPFQYP